MSGPVIMESEFGYRTAGRWPHRWLCTLRTMWDTLRMAFPLGARVIGHRYVAQDETNLWLACEICGAESVTYE